MFIDETLIYVSAGRGGRGCVGFRREKYVPRGGPDGGNGGRGGHIIFEASENYHTLYDIGQKRRFQAEHGAPGSGSLSTGKSGEDIIIKVPVGTLIKDAETGELLKDLQIHQEKFIVANGGRGGLGNAVFKSSIQRTPLKTVPAAEGESRKILLELKLLADCGLVGFPNAGKSSLIRKISSATPKVADYPFTTIKPHLGLVNVGVGHSLVIVDIPGLIEGAADGKGLGHQFLKHVERSFCLIFVIDLSVESPYAQYKTLLAELKKFQPLLLKKPRLIVLNKIDLGEYELEKGFKKEKCPILKVSAIAGTGMKDLKNAAWKMVVDSGGKNLDKF